MLTNNIITVPKHGTMACTFSYTQVKMAKETRKIITRGNTDRSEIEV